jgi:hypothetical protein
MASLKLQLVVLLIISVVFLMATYFTAHNHSNLSQIRQISAIVPESSSNYVDVRGELDEMNRRLESNLTAILIELQRLSNVVKQIKSSNVAALDAKSDDDDTTAKDVVNKAELRQVRASHLHSLIPPTSLQR